ncbi:MAG: hypothetical protein ACU0BF_02535 [Paracoccaceae bacterium]
MTDPAPPDRQTEFDLSMRAREMAAGLSPSDMVAIGLSVIWVAVTAVALIFASPGEGGLATLRFVVTLMALFLPVAMIWLAAAAARSGRVMREEGRRLQAAVDALRHDRMEDRKERMGAPSRDGAEARLARIETALARLEMALEGAPGPDRPSTARAAPVPRRPAAAPSAPEPGAAPDQRALALEDGTRDVEMPLDRLIRALNFPDSEDDEQGIAALEDALEDRRARGMVQAAQDVLTLLSHDGIYADDLDPGPVPPGQWRAFAQGERGEAVEGVGAIRDRTALALAGGRMREDAIFRDAVHHFLRLYDRLVETLAEHASDAELSRLGETRTGRAFMLLARSAGTFD